MAKFNENIFNKMTEEEQEKEIIKAIPMLQEMMASEDLNKVIGNYHSKDNSDIPFCKYLFDNVEVKPIVPYEKGSVLYIPKSAEIDGFDLYGRRLPDGKVELNSGDVLDDFPEEILVIDTVYELEHVKKNEDESGNVINNIE